MGLDPRALPGGGDPAAPSPGAEVEVEEKQPIGTQPAGEPAAEGEPGEELQPTEIPAKEPGAEEWAKLPPWARDAITSGRRSVRAIKQQLLGHGWQLDGNGQLIPPEPVAPRRAAAPAQPVVEETDTGLPADREAFYAEEFRKAELADDPERARMRVSGRMAREIAKRESEGALMSGLRTVLPSTVQGTVNAFKEQFRKDPQRGEAFRTAEAAFDQVIVEMQQEAEAANMPLLITPKLMEYARAVALDRAMPQILAGAGVRKTQQTDAARRAALNVHTAAGSAHPGGGQPPTVDAQEDRILGSLARGSGQDKATLTKGYGERKARGE